MEYGYYISSLIWYECIGLEEKRKDPVGWKYKIRCFRYHCSVVYVEEKCAQERIKL